MGAIIPALMHRIPSELRTSILEFFEASILEFFGPIVCTHIWRLSYSSILEFIGPFRLRSYHLNN
ncbi:hypothetical protein ACJIZ3_006083 [Penstemon smallii]|uniref:Uncharacterized protein n=1 Tax=Penstemon smallii TaxID=265156 RepID=A0ABD3S6R2_9LAMI